MTTPDVPAERGRDELRERLATTLAALVALRDVVRDSGKLNGMEYDELGVQVNRAIAEAEAALLARQEAPAEGLPLSAQLSQAAAWMRVWDECQRLGMDTYGAPSTRTGLDIVLDFIRGRAAPQEARADDPETDGTDFAHPAYFRGKRDGIRGAVDALERVLDHGRRDGTFGDERLQAFAARLDSLRAVAQEAREPEVLVAALRAIVDMEPEPFDFPADWDQQVAACEECKRWKNHPIQQGICDAHRQPLWDRDAHMKSEQRRLHYRMRSIAREALDAHVLAAARPAPETEREPELLGYVVERQRTPGEWVRVWMGRTLWFDHDEAVLDRDAYALDGIPARIRPVYLGAPAPAEATEPSAPEGATWGDVRSGLRAELIAEGMPITEATRIARKVVHRFSAAEATERSES